MKINIYCDNSFLFEINNLNYFINKNNYLKIADFNNIIIKAYPIEQCENSLPFCFSLNQQNNKIICNSRNVKLYNHNDRCDAFVHPFTIPSQNILHTKSYTIKNMRHTLVCYDDRIKIYNQTGEYIYKINCTNVTSDNMNGYINILCEGENKKYVRFCPQEKTFAAIDGNQIQIEDNQITTLQYNSTSLGHIQVCTYLNDSKITLQSTELFSQNQLTFAKNQFLIPYNFLECIKVKDYKSAKQCLHANLADKLNDIAFEEYFGDIHNFELYSTSPLIYTTYYTDYAKDFKFELENNLILDIDFI